MAARITFPTLSLARGMSTFSGIAIQTITQGGLKGATMVNKTMAHVPDLKKVSSLSSGALIAEDYAGLRSYRDEARSFLLYYRWCKDIVDEYVGIFVPGVIGVFLF